MIENGIKPIWVFDGLPPDLKRNELRKRKKMKMAANEIMEDAKEIGDIKEELKQHKRTVKMSGKIIDDAMKMLSLMGLPVIKAKSEAEAQCVDLLKRGLVDAVASEDLDCLTFGCKLMIKGLKAKKDAIFEIDLPKVLIGLELTMDEFIDFCILCGCDYTQTIKNFGPVSALKYIQEYKTIEKVLEALKLENKKKDKIRYIVPSGEHFMFEEARKLFKTPDVLEDVPEVIFVYYKCIKQ